MLNNTTMLLWQNRTSYHAYVFSGSWASSIKCFMVIAKVTTVGTSGEGMSSGGCATSCSLSKCCWSASAAGYDCIHIGHTNPWNRIEQIIIQSSLVTIWLIFVNTMRHEQNGCDFADNIFKKMFKFPLKFHWSLIPRVQLTIFQHWFR